MMKANNKASSGERTDMSISANSIENGGHERRQSHSAEAMWPSGLPPLDFMDCEGLHSPWTSCDNTVDDGSRDVNEHEHAIPQTPTSPQHFALEEKPQDFSSQAADRINYRTDWLGTYHRALLAMEESKARGNREERDGATILPPSVAFAAATSTSGLVPLCRLQSSPLTRASTPRGHEAGMLGPTTLAPGQQHDQVAAASTGVLSGSTAGPAYNVPFSPPRTRRGRVRGRFATRGTRNIVLSQLDVLAGRGGEGNNHKGNRRYWRKVLSLRALYGATGKNNAMKTEIAKMVLEDIQHGDDGHGRFLMRDKSTRRLVEMSDSKALSKIKQALRDKFVPEFARDQYPVLKNK